MNNLCPFCLKAIPLEIAISELNLRICPHCLATFLPASQYAALRRNVFIETRKLWLTALEAKGKNLPQTGSLLCIDHNQALEHGNIPDYGYEGVYPTCCDLQHLPPATMIEILKFGLKLGETGYESQRDSHKPRGVAALLGGIVFRWFVKESTSDGLDTMQYNFKFRDALGPLPDEERTDS